MSKDTEDKDKPPGVILPRWTIELLKMCAGAGAAILIMYVKVELLHSKVAVNTSNMVKQDASIEVQRTLIQSDAARIAILETRHSIMERSITESLIRIESDVKEVKREMKDMQRGGAK